MIDDVDAIETLDVKGVTYWLPKNTGDVIKLVNKARTDNDVICMRGAAHSFPLVGTLEKGPTSGRKYKYLMLSYMNNVTIDGKEVTVDAGCHLGHDPWDPTGISTIDNSLVKQLFDKGLSLPDLGGITHQTVGGFLSTASAGGSLKYSFEDAIISVDIVVCQEGGAAVRTFTKDIHPEFYGAAIATLGLFGVIVSAKFNCDDNYFIAGQEAISTEEECKIKMFDSGEDSLQRHFEKTEYSRLFWWPQKNVKKVVVWKAWRAASELDAKKWAYPKAGDPTSQDLKPYQEVPWVKLPGEKKGSPTPATLGAYFLFSAIGRWPGWLNDVLANHPIDRELIKGAIDVAFYPFLLPKILKIFVPLDGPDGPQLFCDSWYHGLPMDNQMSDELLPIWFTELWIPIEKTQEVMKALQKFYDADTSNASTFNVEIYAAKQNLFWLSPAYNQDVIRIDILWFANSNRDPVAYYQKFWNLLAQYNFRPHWGKYIPSGPKTVPDGTKNYKTWDEYLKGNYPKWTDWLALRNELDPYQVFVNDYWREKLKLA